MNILSPGVVILFRFHGFYAVFLNISTALIYFRMKQTSYGFNLCHSSLCTRLQWALGEYLLNKLMSFFHH